MAAWIAFGLVLAVGMVAAAVMFRLKAPPAVPQAEQAEAGNAAQPSAGQEPEAFPRAAAQDVGAATPPLAVQVRLRISGRLPPGRRDDIVAALEAAGMAPAQVEALPFRITTSRVGYYRGEDREAAEALARLVQPVIEPASGEVALRDYGVLVPDADPGRLDLWIGG
jgi:hypothetical protein